jgi:hypothetical protein
VIADDDTILSVAKMIQLLGRYDADADEMIALGQRYGFRVARGTHGYDYQVYIKFKTYLRSFFAIIKFRITR